MYFQHFLCFLLCWHVSVLILLCVCRALVSDILRAQRGSRLADWPSFSPQQGWGGGGGVSDHQMTNEEAVFVAWVRPQKLAHLWRMFLLMTCGQAADLMHIKSERCHCWVTVSFSHLMNVPQLQTLVTVYSLLLRHVDFVWLEYRGSLSHTAGCSQGFFITAVITSSLTCPSPHQGYPRVCGISPPSSTRPHASHTHHTHDCINFLKGNVFFFGFLTLMSTVTRDARSHQPCSAVSQPGRKHFLPSFHHRWH